MSSPRDDIQSVFSNVVAVLEETKAPHAFIGALPVLAWGRVRATTDLVVVVIAESWPDVAAALERHGFVRGRVTGPSDAGDGVPDIAAFHAGGPKGVRVDLFAAKTDFESEVIASARENRVLGDCIRLARPEASIIYKLLAARAKDVADVESIFEARKIAQDDLDWQFLDEWATAWGIDERLAEYRARFGPNTR